MNKVDEFNKALRSEKREKVYILNNLIAYYNANNIDKINKISSCNSCINSLINSKVFKNWIYDL